MSQPRYEILIRFNEETGALQGAHFRATPTSDAIPIRAEHWQGVSETINQATLTAWETARDLADEKALALATLESAATAAAETAAARIAALEAERDSAIATLTAERDQAIATLREHQAISDSLVTAARSAIAAGDQDALAQILHQASLFGAAREAARLDAEAAELQAKLQAIADAKAKLV